MQGHGHAPGGEASTHRNRLASEPSPYLRQHAGNPVDWWPWGEAAFAEARRRDVPIFLSIGYATCHWCHVMAHESFEDAEVARLLNEAFVCVKVDREERPDVDDVYMAVCQALTGSGGWPLTVFLTPQKRAFFAGTYFPKSSRHGRMGMLELVPAVSEAWKSRRADLERQAEHILQHVRGDPHVHGDEEATAGTESGHTHRIADDARPDPARGGAAAADPAMPGMEALQAGAAALARRFDARHGGFGGPPKFPSPHLLLFLLRWHHRSGEAEALRQAEATLQAMALGGIRDHLGGGFHRYATDAVWLVPHFEKMLYDQAMLAMAFTEAHAVTGDPLYAAVARETLDYVLRDLADPAGGFRCGEDADSEGEEGRFYVWRKAEVLEVLGEADGERFCQAYGVTEEGNHLDEATRKRTGTNILHLVAPLSPAGEAAMAPLRPRLERHRANRVQPELDDKVLSDWNGLAIAALALAGRVLPEPRYTEAARRAAGFLHDSMRGPAGLRHRFRAGARDDVSFLDDHAFLLWGLVELHQATQEPRWLAWALEVAAALRDRFSDPAGGFFLSPLGAEDLGVRRKEAYDGALPSGNGAAAWALHRLALLVGDSAWSDLGDGVFTAFAARLREAPAAFAMTLCALDLAVGPTQEIVVAGDGAEADAMALEAGKGYRPRAVLLRVRPGLPDVAPWTAATSKSAQGQATAYVCEGFACKAPVTTVAELARALRPSTPGSRAQGR